MDSVNEWAAEHGHGEKNRLSPRCARCFDVIGSDEWVIVMADSITGEMQQPVRDGLFARGFDTSPISGDRQFLTHLMLYEIGHTLSFASGDFAMAQR